jgi:hypothetical protein
VGQNTERLCFDGVEIVSGKALIDRSFHGVGEGEEYEAYWISVHDCSLPNNIEKIPWRQGGLRHEMCFFVK